MIILDRLEENTAVLETDGVITEIPRDTVDADAREGDVLILNGGIYAADRKATEERRAAVRSKMRRLIQGK